MNADMPLAEMPGHLIRRLNQRSTAVFQRRLKDAGHDITPVQFSALKTLADHPGLDQARLADRIAYDPATIGGVVKRLAHKGLITRQHSETDRRAFTLSLTPSGKDLLDSAKPIVASLQADILSDLTSQETAALISLMQKALNLVPEREAAPRHGASQLPAHSS